MQKHTYTIMRVQQVQCLYELLFQYDLVALRCPHFGSLNHLVIGGVPYIFTQHLLVLIIVFCLRFRITRFTVGTFIFMLIMFRFWEVVGH